MLLFLASFGISLLGVEALVWLHRKLASSTLQHWTASPMKEGCH